MAPSEISLHQKPALRTNVLVCFYWLRWPLRPCMTVALTRVCPQSRRAADLRRTQLLTDHIVSGSPRLRLDLVRLLIRAIFEQNAVSDISSSNNYMGILCYSSKNSGRFLSVTPVQRDGA